MPFDFINFKHYSIDYSDLFRELNSYQILSDKGIQTEYLKMWIKTLENNDIQLKKELNTQESISKVRLLLQSEPEIFQLPIYFKSNKILLHFRVSIARKIISETVSTSDVLYIPLDDFLGTNSTINWTLINTINDKDLSNLNDSVIIIPFLNGQYNYLVIDGNHRITYKTKNNFEYIHSLIISEQSVIEQSLFSSGFDKNFYIMYNELNHMTNATHFKKENAFQLVQKSYLKDGKFKFS